MKTLEWILRAGLCQNGCYYWLGFCFSVCYFFDLFSAVVSFLWCPDQSWFRLPPLIAGTPTPEETWHKIDCDKDKPASQPHPHGMSGILLPGVATQCRSLDTVRFQHCIQQDFAMSNLPQTTPTNRLPMCQLCMHNMTSQLCFCVCLIFFFFSFSPWLCVLHHPLPTTHTLPCAPYVQNSKHQHHRKSWRTPPSTPATESCHHIHSHRCLYTVIAMPPLRASLHAHTEASHMHDTCKACGAWCFCVGESVFCFCFLLLFFFFFSPVRLCTLLTHIWTPSLHAPTLAWPEGKTVAPSQGLDDGNGPRCIIRPCPAHGFCARLAVGMWLTTLFDPQRDLELAVAWSPYMG